MKTFNEFNEKDYKKVVGEKPVIMFFSATWCSDCRFIKPKMPELEEEYKDFEWIAVDRDENIDVARDLRVMGIPSFVVFNKGEEIGRLVNKDRKTKEEVETFLDSVIK